MSRKSPRRAVSTGGQSKWGMSIEPHTAERIGTSSMQRPKATAARYLPSTICPLVTGDEKSSLIDPEAVSRLKSPIVSSGM